MVVGHWVLLETVAIWYTHDDKQFSWYLKISWIILISIIKVHIRSILTSVDSNIKIFLKKHLWTPSIIFSLSLIPYMDSASLKSITHLSNKYLFKNSLSKIVWNKNIDRELYAYTCFSTLQNWHKIVLVYVCVRNKASLPSHSVTFINLVTTLFLIAAFKNKC